MVEKKSGGERPAASGRVNVYQHGSNDGGEFGCRRRISDQCFVVCAVSSESSAKDVTIRRSRRLPRATLCLNSFHMKSHPMCWLLETRSE